MTTIQTGEVAAAAERVRRFLDEYQRPTPFAPQGFLPVDHLSTITRTGDRLLVSDLRALLDAHAALGAIVSTFDHYMRPGMEIGDGPEPWQAVVAAVESARKTLTLSPADEPPPAGSDGPGWVKATPLCEHRGHAPGEWYYACCACSGVPNGCEHCETDWDGNLLYPDGVIPTGEVAR